MPQNPLKRLIDGLAVPQPARDKNGQRVPWATTGPDPNPRAKQVFEGVTDTLLGALGVSDPLSEQATPATGLGALLGMIGPAAMVGGLKRIAVPRNKEGAQQLRDALRAFYTKHGGNLTRAQADEYRQLTGDYNDLALDLATPGTAEDVLPEAKRMSTLSAPLVAQARNDLISNKPLALDVLEATAGTGYNELTPIDHILRGTSPRGLTERDILDTFAASNDMLRSQYGSKVPLYRAPGRQIPKPTTNWATTEEYAQQFGPKVIQEDVPIEDILMVNTGLGKKGGYHELIRRMKLGIAAPVGAAAASQYGQPTVDKPPTIR